MSARIYRREITYRNPGSYRGLDSVPSVSVPSVVAACSCQWLQASARGMDIGASWALRRSRIASEKLGWERPEPRGSVMSIFLHDLSVRAISASVHWGTFTANCAQLTLRWGEAMPHGLAYTLAWADYLGQRERGMTVGWRRLSPRGQVRAVPWGALAARSLARSAFWRNVVARGGMVALPWGPAGSRRNDVGLPWPVDPEPGDGPIVVPSLPVYIMIPTLTAVLLPDRTPLALLSASVALDGEAWAWNFSAPIPHRELAKISLEAGEDPPEIEVTINGYVWTFLVDGYDDNRRFGSKTATLRGRSRSAELAAPYAPVRSRVQDEARTAAQLADEELTDTGWTLAWDAVDWLVPGGTWSYQDLAPIDAIARLAESIGAAVESDPALRTLTVKPAYAESPWAWGAATPYAILPAAVLTQGDGSWQGGTNADGVYVYAENAPTGALVKIAGTAGSSQLPMIVERLAVHADAQRERGRQALAAAGRIRSVNRTLPLFPSPADPGVIPRGALVEFQEAPEPGAAAEVWRGMVTGVRIEASRNGSALSVRQHLSIERQYRDAD